MSTATSMICVWLIPNETGQPWRRHYRCYWETPVPWNRWNLISCGFTSVRLSLLQKWLIRIIMKVITGRDMYLHDSRAKMFWTKFARAVKVFDPQNACIINNWYQRQNIFMELGYVNCKCCNPFCSCSTLIKYTFPLQIS